MHDIWNPWHGCTKCSEGCENCYMYYLDRIHGNGDSSVVTRNRHFSYPLSRTRDGRYKVQSGEMLRVCMTSDFFVEEADPWREEAWAIIHQRPDVKFFLLTKRPQRVAACLPRDWGDGWENVFFNVTCENQRRADERMPLLLSLPFKHKGVMCAPFIGPVHLAPYLAGGQVEQVICDGENYSGARPCHFEWVEQLHGECVAANVTFHFIGTGARFVKNGREYRLTESGLQSRMAHKSGMNFAGKPMVWHLTDPMGLPITPQMLYTPFYGQKCDTCGMRPVCNGCSRCGRCE